MMHFVKTHTVLGKMVAARLLRAVKWQQLAFACKLHGSLPLCLSVWLLNLVTCLAKPSRHSIKRPTHRAQRSPPHPPTSLLLYQHPQPPDTTSNSRRHQLPSTHQLPAPRAQHPPAPPSSTTPPSFRQQPTPPTNMVMFTRTTALALCMLLMHASHVRGAPVGVDSDGDAPAPVGATGTDAAVSAAGRHPAIESSSSSIDKNVDTAPASLTVERERRFGGSWFWHWLRSSQKGDTSRWYSDAKAVADYATTLSQAHGTCATLKDRHGSTLRSLAKTANGMLSISVSFSAEINYVTASCGWTLHVGSGANEIYCSNSMAMGVSSSKAQVGTVVGLWYSPNELDGFGNVGSKFWDGLSTLTVPSPMNGGSTSVSIVFDRNQRHGAIANSASLLKTAGASPFGRINLDLAKQNGVKMFGIGWGSTYGANSKLVDVDLDLFIMESSPGDDNGRKVAQVCHAAAQETFKLIFDFIQNPSAFLHGSYRPNGGGGGHGAVASHTGATGGGGAPADTLPPLPSQKDTQKGQDTFEKAFSMAIGL